MRMIKSKHRSSNSGHVKRSRGSFGFTLVEIIITIGILAILTSVFAPSLLSYVERTRAGSDVSGTNDIVEAIEVALSKMECYNEALASRERDNVSCYIDSGSEEDYIKIVTQDATERYAEQYTFDDSARTADGVVFAAAGNMYGMTITFQPSQDNGRNVYYIEDAVVNKFTPNAKMLIECENLYAELRRTVGASIEIDSYTYQYSDYTVFIRLGATGSFDEVAEDTIEVYGQYNGTNLMSDEVGSNITSSDRVVADEDDYNNQGGNGFIGGEPEPDIGGSVPGAPGDNTGGEVIIPTLSKEKLGAFITEMGTQIKAVVFTTSSIVEGQDVSSDGSRTILAYVNGTTCYVGNRDGGKVLSPADAGRMFSGTKYPGYTNISSVDLSGLDTTNVISMYGMFDGCTYLRNINFTGIDTSKVTIMSSMFSNCTSLTSVDLSEFNVAKTPNTSSMFSVCINLKYIYVAYDWNIPTASSTSMFYRCTSLIGGNGTKYNASNVDGLYSHIDAANNPGYFTSKSGATGDGGLTYVPTGAIYYVGVTNVNHGNYTGATAIFRNGDYFPAQTLCGDVYVYGNYEYRYGYYHDGSKWVLNSANSWGVKCLNNVAAPGEMQAVINDQPLQHMAYTFYNCSNLTTAPSIPNGVTNLTGTFKGCTSLTLSPYIPSSVTNMRETYRGCTALAQAPVVTGNVTNLKETFYGCTNLISAPVIPNKVINMESTFYGCTKLASITAIPGSVTNLSKTFYECKALTGTIEIDSIPSSYADCFKKTVKTITLTGASSLLSELAATDGFTDKSTNDNVRATLDDKDKTLPPEYTLLEYIESNGSQYIDTGVAYSNNYAYKMDMQVVYTTSSPTNQIMGFNGHAGMGIGSAGATFWECGDHVLNPNTSYKLSWYKKGANYSRTINGTTYSGTNGNTNASWNGNLMLFAAATDAFDSTLKYYCHCKLGPVKIYVDDGLVRDFVPVKRNSDGALGMYDLENGKFYPNQGAGAFNSKLPDGYVRLEYIESTGHQYINTGVVGGAVWEFDIQFTDLTKRQLMGYGGSGTEYWGVAEGSGTGAGKYGLASWSYMNVNAGNRDIVIHSYGVGNNYLSANGTRLGVSNTDVSSKEYCLFSLGGGYNCYAKLYGATCTRNGVMIRNFIPCKSPSGEVGLYDEVEGKFYGNDLIPYSGKLPDGYVALEYIESTGSQYIDTGVPVKSTIVSQLKFNMAATTGGVIYGSITNVSTDTNDYRLFNHQGVCYLDFPNGSRVYGGTMSAGVDYEVEVGNYYVKDLKTGTNIISGAAVTFEPQADTITMWRDGLGNGYSSGKLYYLKIYDNGTLIRDFIPCKNASGEAGLYDLVNNKFHGNNGLPSGYTQVEYLESTGTQWIDTGVSVGANTWVDADLMFNSAFDYNMMFGSWAELAVSLRAVNTVCAAGGGAQTQNLGSITTTGVKYNIKIGADKGYTQDWVKYDLGGSANVSGRRILLFAASDVISGNNPYAWGGSYGVGRIYGFKIYNGNTLVRDFVPCKNSAGVLGMYDLVGRQFYTNAGSGTFTAGAAGVKGKALVAGNNLVYMFIAGGTRS